VDWVEKYLRHLHEIRSSGEATDETSYYTPLNNLLDDIGKTVKPRVRCILQLKNRGAGHPDGGLYTLEQFQKLKSGDPLPGQKPARGAIEVKPTSDDAWVTAEGDQVTKYWTAYGQVVVTNYRDFVLLTRDREGLPAKLDSFRLAADEDAFWDLTAHPRKAAKEFADRFVEFLKRVMLSTATIVAPKDLAWLLASVARDAKLRVDEKPDLPALATLRSALEQALGLKFEGEKGEHFFRSTLIQTLFYGIFSAWVLWSKEHPPRSKDRFDWKKAEWSLHVPMIRVLFEEVSLDGPSGEDTVLILLMRPIRDCKAKLCRSRNVDTLMANIVNLDAQNGIGAKWHHFVSRHCDKNIALADLAFGTVKTDDGIPKYSDGLA